MHSNHPDRNPMPSQSLPSRQFACKPDFDECMARVYAWYEQQIIDRPPVRFHHHNVEYHSGLFEYRFQATAYITLAVIGDNRHAYLGVRLNFQSVHAKDPRKTRFNYTGVTGNPRF